MIAEVENLCKATLTNFFQSFCIFAALGAKIAQIFRIHEHGQSLPCTSDPRTLKSSCTEIFNPKLWR